MNGERLSGNSEEAVGRMRDMQFSLLLTDNWHVQWRVYYCATIYMSAVEWDTSRLLCSPPACIAQSIFYQPILYHSVGCSLGFSIKMFLYPINAFPPVRLFRWWKKKTPDEILGAAMNFKEIPWLGGNKNIILDFLVRHSLGAVADIICCSILMCTDKASLMQAPTIRRRDRTRG